MDSMQKVYIFLKHLGKNFLDLRNELYIFNNFENVNNTFAPLGHYVLDYF